MKMKNKKPLLIIDGNNLGHRAYHANSGLSYKGRSTAVIFGVLNIIRAAISRYKPKKVIVVWDGSRSKHRLNILPEYKGKRRANAEKNDFDYDDWNRQKSFTQKMIRRLGITQVHHMELEADDYIYWLVTKYYGVRPILILSNDKDFHQLVAPGVSQVLSKPTIGEMELCYNNFGDNLKTLYPKLSFFETMTPQQHLDYLILTGDDSDNIPGFGGIGDVRANAFLMEYEGIQTYLDDSAMVGKVDKKKLAQVYEKNRSLIDMEYFHHKFLKGKVELKYLFDEKQPEVNTTKFIKLAMKYNLKSFTFPSFIKTFTNAS